MTVLVTGHDGVKTFPITSSLTELVQLALLDSQDLVIDIVSFVEISIQS